VAAEGFRNVEKGQSGRMSFQADESNPTLMKGERQNGWWWNGYSLIVSK